MALLVTQGNSDLSSTFLECINSMDTNLGTNTYGSVSSARTRAFTPSRADSIVGVVAMVFTYTINTFKNFDVRLEENVAGTWTTRATGTYDISGLISWGVYMLDVYFDTPYTVTTSANTWRLAIQTSSGATGNNHTYVCLETNSSGNPYLIPITATTNTFTSGTDGIMVGSGHELSIDTGCVLVGSAYNKQMTNMAYSLMAGHNSKIELTSTAPYNFDSKGGFLLSKTSSFKIGDSEDKIPRANKITFRVGTWNDTSVASTNGTYYTGVSSLKGGFGDMEFYGSPYTKATLTADANTGQKDLVVDEIPASWQVGDLIYIDTLDKQGYAATSVNRYTPLIIGSFPDANTVRLTVNLPDKRLAGATVINASDCGIELGKLSSVQSSGVIQWIPASMNTIVLDGVYNTSHRFNDRSATDPYTNHYGKTIYQKVSNSVLAFISTNGALSAMAICKNGFSVCDSYIQYGAIYGITGYYRSNFKSGAVQFKRNIISQLNTSLLSSGNLTKLIFEDNYISNGNLTTTGQVTINSVNGSIKNNKFYGNNYACFDISYLNRTIMNSNIYERSDYAYRFNGGIVSSTDIEPEYTNLVLGTGTFSGSAAIDFVIDTPNTEVTVDETIADAIYGSKLRILNDNNETKNDRVLWPAGNIQRTGDSLADPLALFNYAIRFNPVFDNVEFNQLYPIGNQLWNTLSVIYKVYIPNEEYWAGEHTMPTLSVLYDGGLNEAIAVMEQVAEEWYNISVEFTPTTEVWVIDITLFGFSDQSVPNSYFYLWQCIVNKPDGSELKLSNLDLFYQALPITPTIATLTDFSENIRKIENALPIINTWVQKASKFIPHNQDL